MASGAWPLVQPGRLLLQQHQPMRDGVALAADVWLPPAVPHGVGPWPALVVRSQHGTERYLPWVQRFINGPGFAVVLQDVRGRGDSGGVDRARSHCRYINALPLIHFIPDLL
jgi:predicted acyl esterase